MNAATFPSSIAKDPVVLSIARRAAHAKSQMQRVSTNDTQARLQGQLDAYIADLMDAVRAASARTGEHVTVTPESMGLLIDA